MARKQFGLKLVVTRTVNCIAKGRDFPIKAYLFDFDGTLADTLSVCIESFRDALLKNLGRVYSTEEIVAHFGLNEEGILRRIAPDCVDACLRDFEAAYRQRLLTVQPVPGIREMLEDLLQIGVKLALITGKGEQTAYISLRHLDLEQFFESVEIGSAERNAKDERIREVVARMGIDPHEAAYVGDAPSDMDGARDAGVVPIAAAWMPGTDIEALEARHPAHLFRTLDDFRAWVIASRPKGGG